MIGIPGNVRVYLACGVTDMRKGFDGLAARVQTTLRLDPHGGALFVFRGRRGDLIKVLWWDGQGLCLFAKRLERGRFLWPQAKDGSVVLTAAQLDPSKNRWPFAANCQLRIARDAGDRQWRGNRVFSTATSG